jgi:ATP-dependent Lon protease
LTEDQLSGVNVHYVTTIDEVLGIALPSNAAEAKKDEEVREQVLAGALE